MRLTHRGWALILVLVALLLGFATGGKTYYPREVPTCSETVTIEEGYAFCDG